MEWLKKWWHEMNYCSNCNRKLGQYCYTSVIDEGRWCSEECAQEQLLTEEKI